MGTEPKLPDLGEELARRIRLVRRDVGTLLWHFTRSPTEESVVINQGVGTRTITPASASAVLEKILREGRLLGGSAWTDGDPCICFTEAPIQEFNSLFQLVSIASSDTERPRYEPYGVAVSKRWLFSRGGRPVIYDDPGAIENHTKEQRYRIVPYDPCTGLDYTWEREWRLPAESLELDPRETLVAVPTAQEAFEMAYELADMEADWDDDQPVGAYHVLKWQTVSLDLFGFEW